MKIESWMDVQILEMMATGSFPDFISFFSESKLSWKFKSKSNLSFFFSCVQKDKCETNALGIRFSNVDGALDGLLEGLFVSKAENASCPDIDTVCCNELDVKITIDTNLDACTDFENDGYRFVSSFYLVEFKIWMPGYSWNSKFHFKFNGKAKILTCITVSEVCSTDWPKKDSANFKSIACLYHSKFCSLMT